MPFPGHVYCVHNSIRTISKKWSDSAETKKRGIWENYSRFVCKIGWGPMQRYCCRLKWADYSCTGDKWIWLNFKEGMLVCFFMLLKLLWNGESTRLISYSSLENYELKLDSCLTDCDFRVFQWAPPGPSDFMERCQTAIKEKKDSTLVMTKPSDIYLKWRRENL